MAKSIALITIKGIEQPVPVDWFYSNEMVLDKNKVSESERKGQATIYAKNFKYIGDPEEDNMTIIIDGREYFPDKVEWTGRTNEAAGGLTEIVGTLVDA